MPRSVRLLLVEEHRAIADGLTALLGAQGGIEVVGTAFDPTSASELIQRVQPDVVLCNVMLGGRDGGLELLERSGAATRFLMYSPFDYPAHHARAIAAGAAGFLTKYFDADAMTAAVRRTARGLSSFPDSVVTSARDASPRPTTRELQLILLMAEGASNDQIAQRLGVAVKTVEGSLRRMFDRYQVENRTRLAWLALGQGWLTSAAAEKVPIRTTTGTR